MTRPPIESVGRRRCLGASYRGFACWATTARRPKTAGEAILRSYPNAVLSTDAHNLKRCSGLSAGFQWVRDNFGRTRSDDLRARADQVLMSVLPMKEPAVV